MCSYEKDAKKNKAQRLTFLIFSPMSQEDRMVAQGWWAFKDNRNHRHVMVDKVLLPIPTHGLHPFTLANLQLPFDAFFSSIVAATSFFPFTHQNHIFPKWTQTGFAVKMTKFYTFIHSTRTYYSLPFFFFLVYGNLPFVSHLESWKFLYIMIVWNEYRLII